MTRRKPTRRPVNRSGAFKQFARAALVSAVASFTVASCALHPELRDQVDFGPALAQLGIGTEAPRAAAAVSEYVQTNFSGCRQLFPGGQPPTVPARPALRELCYDSFAILHSGNTRTPVFVAQRLNRQMLQQAQAVSRTDRFFADARLPATERAELGDYRNSGYSRGHLAPAADMHTPEAMAQSFSLANMVPQDQRHNGGPWAKIESDTRKYIMRAQGDVYVFTGPAYGGSMVDRAGRVAVPTHLFKAVYDAATGRSWVHWQANSPDTKAGPPIRYDEFLQRTGMRLMSHG